MSRTHYPPANATVQWYGDDYAGDLIAPNVIVWHTTEGSSWPGYDGNYPHLTAMPDFKRKRLDWRQHCSLLESARALRNEAGGVETNTLNCIQVELVGTCSRATHLKWRLLGVRHIYWPKAPEWALRCLAKFVRFVDDTYPDFTNRDAAPRGWLRYPDSYGDSKVRMSGAEWRKAYGHVGHQHVPENDHGDPGVLDVAALIAYSKGLDVDATRRRRRRKPNEAEPASFRERVLRMALRWAREHDSDKIAARIKRRLDRRK